MFLLVPCLSKVIVISTSKSSENEKSCAHSSSPVCQVILLISANQCCCSLQIIKEPVLLLGIGWASHEKPTHQQLVNDDAFSWYPVLQIIEWVNQSRPEFQQDGSQWHLWMGVGIFRAVALTVCRVGLLLLVTFSIRGSPTARHSHRLRSRKQETELSEVR